MRRFTGLCVLGLALAAVVTVSRGAKPAGREPSILFNDKGKYWVSAKEMVHRSIPDLLEQHQSELRRGLAHAKLMRGNPDLREVAITFDDGPHPKYTPKILAILKQYNAKATFFVVGEMAEKYPYLVRAELAAGHSVGNHTYHHVDLTQIPPVYIAAELKACGQVLSRIGKKPPHLFRPPGGDYNDEVAQVAEALGYITVLWTNDPGDYASPGTDVIETRVIDKISNGSIILIHDGIRQTIDALPSILKYLQSQGYETVTVDQMLAHASQDSRTLGSKPTPPLARPASNRTGRRA